MNVLLKIITTVLTVCCIVVAVALLCFSLTEYRPEPTETLEIPDQWTLGTALHYGESCRIMTWNIGYCGRGREAASKWVDGLDVKGMSTETVNRHCNRICHVINRQDADITLIQMADHRSARSFYIDQTKQIKGQLSPGVYTPDHRAFVPYPWPMVGNIHSGSLTLSSHKILAATRERLPESKGWPARLFYSKPCVLKTELALEDGSILAVMNVHLPQIGRDRDASAAMWKSLSERIASERQAGHAVILGGSFSHVLDPFPVTTEGAKALADLVPLALPVEFIPGDLHYVPVSNETPTARSLNQPYKAGGDGVMTYICDGFFVSDDIIVESCQVQDLGFEDSDHNPVILNFTLSPQN